MSPLVTLALALFSGVYAVYLADRAPLSLSPTRRIAHTPP